VILQDLPLRSDPLLEGGVVPDRIEIAEAVDLWAEGQAVLKGLLQQGQRPLPFTDRSRDRRLPARQPRYVR